jgi:hypothetical protein
VAVAKWAKPRTSMALDNCTSATVRGQMLARY